MCCCVHSIYFLCYLCYVVFGCSLLPLSLFAFVFPVTGEGINNITPSANILGSPCFNSGCLFCVHSILLYMFAVFAVFCFSVYLPLFSYMDCWEEEQEQPLAPALACTYPCGGCVCQDCVYQLWKHFFAVMEKGIKNSYTPTFSTKPYQNMKMTTHKHNKTKPYQNIT